MLELTIHGSKMVQLKQLARFRCNKFISSLQRDLNFGKIKQSRGLSKDRRVGSKRGVRVAVKCSWSRTSLGRGWTRMDTVVVLIKMRAVRKP